MSVEERPGDVPVTRDHRRQWRRCLYVYPVIARRSKGLSIGVNLNPDKRCNFACPYCQINHRIRRDLSHVDIAVLRDELRLALAEADSGGLWREPRFATTPPELRRINDIAFSGDGEPTCLEKFDQAVEAAAAVKRELARHDVKLVVITNSSKLDSPQFLRALPILDSAGGEIWAKLDAGTEDHFRRVNRPGPGIPLCKILDNIAGVARGRPVVIQSLFCRLDGAGPGAEELGAYCARLREIIQTGGRIKLIQVHTIARPPTSPAAAALSDAELDAVAERIRRAVADVPVETYYGSPVAPQSR